MAFGRFFPIWKLMSSSPGKFFYIASCLFSCPVLFLSRIPSIWILVLLDWPLIFLPFLLFFILSFFPSLSLFLPSVSLSIKFYQFNLWIIISTILFLQSSFSFPRTFFCFLIFVYNLLFLFHGMDTISLVIFLRTLMI